jgi:hypothetical protein
MSAITLSGRFTRYLPPGALKPQKVQAFRSPHQHPLDDSKTSQEGADAIAGSLSFRGAIAAK